MALYHKDLGWPRHMRNPRRLLRLRYTFHALRAAADDRYGPIRPPADLDTGKAELIEAEVAPNGNITKAVWRLQWDADRDVVLVVLPFDGTVKTLWLNRADDTHSTLDEGRYERP